MSKLIIKSISVALVLSVTAISYAVNNNSVESIANSIETTNPLILPTIKDKISYVFDGETNGLHNVSLKEIISLNDDTVAQTRFLQCSVTYKNHFVFSEACHSMRYKNYMTKYNLEPLQKIRHELVFNDILAQAGKDLVRVGIEAKQPISRIN